MEQIQVGGKYAHWPYTGSCDYPHPVPNLTTTAGLCLRLTFHTRRGTHLHPGILCSAEHGSCTHGRGSLPLEMAREEQDSSELRGPVSRLSGCLS